MAQTEYERRASQDYIDRNPTRYDASSGWGVMIGVAAILAVLAMLFFGFGSSNPDATKTTPAVERTTPPPSSGPTTQPAPAPTPAPTNPN
jgi:hypothetical protein